MSLTLTRRHNVDRFGYLIPTRYGNVPMVGAVATYRPGEGRFGGAVAVEEGTTNLHQDPLNPARIIHASTITKELYETDTPFGFRQVAKLDGPGNDAYIAWFPRPTLDPNQPVTVSVWLRTLEGELRTPLMYLGSGYRTADNTYKGVGEWTQITKTFQPGQFTSGTAVYFFKGSPGPVEVCAVQVEQKPFATSFVDGTRAAGRLVYPTSVFNPAQGTISMWVRKHQLLDYNARVFWLETGSYRFGVHDLPSGGLTWAYVTGGNNQTTGGFLTPGTWHHLVMTWHRDEGWMRGYLDGEPVGSRTFDPGTDPGFVYSNTWGLGATVSGSQAFNGLFDELLILPYAASEEEIASWYEAQGPLPPHPQALLQWDRQAVRPAQMVKL